MRETATQNCETFIVDDEVMVRRRVLPAGRYSGWHRGDTFEIVLSEDDCRQFGYRRPRLDVTDLVAEGYVQCAPAN